MNAIVVQFGLAMMPLGGSVARSPLTSATTNGTSGSMRNAEELSTTVAPAAANFGAYAREPVAPAENSARSRPLGSAISVSSTVTSVPFHGSVVPADRADAKNRISSTGKSRSTRSRRITPPTCPVAPTTPTRMGENTNGADRKGSPGFSPRVGRAWPKPTGSLA